MKGLQRVQATQQEVNDLQQRLQHFMQVGQMEQQHIVIQVLLYQRPQHTQIQPLLVIQFHIMQMGMELRQAHKLQLIPLNTLLTDGGPQQAAALKEGMLGLHILLQLMKHYMPNIRPQLRKEVLHFQPLQLLDMFSRDGIKRLLAQI